MGMASDDIRQSMFAVERFDLLPTLTNQMPQAVCDGKAALYSSGASWQMSEVTS